MTQRQGSRLDELTENVSDERIPRELCEEFTAADVIAVATAIDVSFSEDATDELLGDPQFVYLAYAIADEAGFEQCRYRTVVSNLRVEITLGDLDYIAGKLGAMPVNPAQYVLDRYLCL